MKNFRFLFVALMSVVCLLGFSSCEKDDEGSGVLSGGTPYSGELVGTWIGEVDGEDLTCKFSFYSNGSCNQYISGSAGDYNNFWMSTDALFYVQDNLLVLRAISATSSSGELTENFESVYSYWYIVELSSKYVQLYNLEEYTNTIDYEYGKELIADINENRLDYCFILYKQ